MKQHSMFSPTWHRVEAIRPRLRPQTEIERHVIRGEVWYVARDPMSRRANRFSVGVNAVVMRMDGQRTLGQIWAEIVERFGEHAPSQDQIIQLVSQLYQSDLLQVDGAIDVGEIGERSEKVRRRQVLQRFQNPMYLRLALFDPDRFLASTMHIVRPLFSVWGLLLWLAAVCWFVAEAAFHWQSLTGGIADRVLATGNLVVLLLVFPLLKLLHELGHGYATKVFGGPVHELGVMFLVMMPAPYVDASSSAMFPSKWRRIVVSAAGMMVELFVAAIAMAVWLSVEPGLARAVAFNVMLIASVSTVAFNGNPLLRFDAYYILSDLLEIPNLAMRATQYWAYLCQRYLFGMVNVDSPVSARGERFWFLVYAPAALAYRLVVLFSIATFIAGRFFFVGVLLAIWTVAVSIGWPLVKAVRFILVAPPVAGHRWRAVVVTLAVLAVVAGAVVALPVPHGTVVRGVVWVPDEARVTAGVSGFLRSIERPAGATVARGDTLMQLDDPYLAARKKLIQAKLAELQARLLQAEASTPFETQVLRKQIELGNGELAEADRQLDALTVKAPGDGTLIVPNADDAIGAYFRKGELIAYVMPAGAVTVRAVVPESAIDTVEGETISVAARFDGAPDNIVYGLPVKRIVPQATRELPSAALAQTNGGPFALDPTTRTGLSALLPFFEVDVALPPDLPLGRWGERAWLRFDHGSAPLATRLYRDLRQLFLKVFND